MPPSAPPGGWKALRFAVISLGVLLAPVFFGVMFVTVTALVRPAFGWWAWSVPAATEGSFAFLYGLDLLLQWRRKPMGWLRLTPYPFAVVSLVLNVWADRADLPGMLGHAAVTCAFFLPLLAGESAVRSLSVSDEQVRLAAETKAACRYARDVLRDQRGPLWRWRVPSLLRIQVLRRTPPQAVREAIAEGPERWEQAANDWVVRGLTRKDLLAAEERSKREAIQQAAAPAQAAPAPVRSRPARSGSQRRGPSPAKVPQPATPESAPARYKAEQFFRENPGATYDQAVAATGVGRKTVERAAQVVRLSPEDQAPLAEVRSIGAR